MVKKLLAISFYYRDKYSVNKTDMSYLMLCKYVHSFYIGNFRNLGKIYNKCIIHCFSIITVHIYSHCHIKSVYINLK